MQRRTQARLTQGLTLLLAVVGMLFLIASGSAAHPNLRANESSPSPGALLNSSPARVQLVFSVESQGLVPEQSFFWVIKESGLSVVALGQVDLSVADRNVMAVTLPHLDPGVYRVKWVAVSFSDQGFSEGSFSFAVAGQ